MAEGNGVGQQAGGKSSLSGQGGRKEVEALGTGTVKSRGVGGTVILNVLILNG